MADLTTLLSKFLTALAAGTHSVTGTLTMGSGATGTMAVTTKTATINCATATGTGTGTLTVTEFIPANAIVFGFSARVSTILAGASLGTWGIGPSTDTDMWGTGLAKDAATLVNASTYTVANTATVINTGAATDLVVTASAGVFSTGAIKVALHYALLTPATS